jgi:sigma-54-dependent transcriptional regulator
MREGLLLPDLRWRLAFLEIPVPALSARIPDILPLADRFLDAARLDFRLGGELTWDTDAVSALLAHTWPGNIRELRGVVEHGALHCAAGGRLTIILADLPKHLQGEYPPLRECSLEVRQAAVAWMLAKVQGNQSAAARRLGLHRNTIARRASVPDPESPSADEP